ncbi:hypothetical protein C8J57DRAFT_6452 [Mycena rebaudengoi]|nr:hypothetical protein C8J57DRAFT_6452 [Mycena rebaudengoi]
MRIIHCLTTISMTDFNTSDNTLQRGQACSNCRRRKMRCDGLRPVCGQCSRASRPDDCEYTDHNGRTRAEILEEDISRVERRIYELEHPAIGPNESILLHHPYQHIPRASQVPDSSVTLVATSNLLNSNTEWWNLDEPPIQMRKTIVDAFLTYAPDWGFFLNTSRFRHDAFLDLPIGNHLRPSPALLNTVYLIGITLSGSSDWKMHEHAFLGRALSSLALSLSGLHPKRVLHSLQAELMLSIFFFTSGRFLKGRYHATTAISLAAGIELHKIRSERESISGSAVRALQPFTDAIEEGEHIDACWTTLVLDRLWAVALDTQPNYNADHALDAPWPIDDYNHPGFPASLRSCETISKFLGGIDSTHAENSSLAVLAKAAILWQRANKLVTTWTSTPDPSPEAAKNFHNAFKSLDTLIENFLGHVMSAPQPSVPTTGKARSLCVGLSITQAALIQLHGPFPPTNETSKEKCLEAAKSIIDIAVDTDFGDDFAYINPIMGTIWTTACEIVIDEIVALKSLRPAWDLDIATAAEAELVDTFTRGFGAMCQFQNAGSLMSWSCRFYFICS